MTDRDSLAAMLNLADALKDLEWHDHAACKDSDPEAFFPGPTHPIPETARQLCLACPVKTQCYEQGMNERYGVWANTSERQRGKIRSQARKAAEILGVA